MGDAKEEEATMKAKEGEEAKVAKDRVRLRWLIIIRKDTYRFVGMRSVWYQLHTEYRVRILIKIPVMGGIRDKNVGVTCDCVSESVSWLSLWGVRMCVCVCVDCAVLSDLHPWSDDMDMDLLFEKFWAELSGRFLLVFTCTVYAIRCLISFLWVVGGTR